ncbi:uncharacterized protein LOC141623203 [Silene latifolia]|uniref:uncharacterized protein LOC141623203 n=1 Tax=Silene latifolia TaxID=37657 RepID=UPI003D777D1F
MGDNCSNDKAAGKRPVMELQEQDDDNFVWKTGDDANESNSNDLLLVGKLWANKAINVKAAIDTMTKLWNLKEPVIGNVLDAKDKIFAFRFNCDKDKAKVVDGQPWHFDKYIWCFNDPCEEGKLTDTPLFNVPFWSRIYDLPLRGRSNEMNIRRIAAQLGMFVSLDTTPYPELERAVRVRILHDVRKPVRAHTSARMPYGLLTKFDVKYERLPIFCYGCGLLGHGEKECDEGPYEESELAFGEWLRASPKKVLKTNAELAGSKVARALSREFEAEQRRLEEENVEKMIGKLQAISLANKKKKTSG